MIVRNEKGCDQETIYLPERLPASALLAVGEVLRLAVLAAVETELDEAVDIRLGALVAVVGVVLTVVLLSSSSESNEQSENEEDDGGELHGGRARLGPWNASPRI